MYQYTQNLSGWQMSHSVTQGYMDEKTEASCCTVQCCGGPTATHQLGGGVGRVAELLSMYTSNVDHVDEWPAAIRRPGRLTLRLSLRLAACQQDCIGSPGIPLFAL